MASTTTDTIITAIAPVASTISAPSRHRRITPEAGRALEILGHAIEYLTDEFVEQGLDFTSENEQLEAVRLLMGINRQIYFECPVVPTFAERCRAWLHLNKV